MMVCGHHPHLFFFFLNHKCSGEQNILNIKPIFADNKTSCQLKSVCVYFPVPWEGPGLLDSLVYTSGEVCLQGDCRTGGSCRHVAVHFQRLTCCGKAPFSSCLLEWCLSSAVRAAACWKWAEQQPRPRSLAVVISASQTVKHRTDGLFVAAFSRHPPVITVNREEGMSLACVLNVGCWHMKCFKPRSSFTSPDQPTSCVPCYSTMLALAICVATQLFNCCPFCCVKRKCTPELSLRGCSTWSYKNLQAATIGKESLHIFHSFTKLVM